MSTRTGLTQKCKEIIAQLQALQTQQSELLLRLAQLDTENITVPPTVPIAPLSASLPVAATQARASIPAPTVAPAGPLDFATTYARRHLVLHTQTIRLGHHVIISNPGPSQPTEGVVVRINGDRYTIQAAN